MRRNDLMTIDDVRTYKYYAGGEWRPAASGRTFDVHQPFGGQLYAKVAAGGAEDARIAVQAAADAFPAWSQTTPAERAGLFLKAGEVVKRRRTEIAEVLARETGSTISFATFQQDLVAATLQQVAGWVFLPKGEVLETNLPGTHSHLVRPHVFDSRRKYLQGIRDGAQGARRNRQCEFTDRQRRDSRADGRGARQWLG